LRLTIIIGLLVALGVAGALVIDLDGDDAQPPSKNPVVQQADKPAAKPEAVASTTSPVSKSSSVSPTVAKPETSVATSKSAKLEAPKDIPKLVAPTFDVVRVNPSGDAVIAGRAAPGAKVSVLAGNKLVGTAKADDRGEWVLIPEKPLESGSRELSLEAKLPGAETVKSKEVVVVAVPDRPEAGTSLAVIMPRKGDGPSKVLQSASSGSSASTTSQVAADSNQPSDGGSKAVANQAVAKKIASVAPKPSPASSSASSSASVKKASTLVARPPVSLESVDYDEKGDLILSGRADVGATINLYVDNAAIGQTVGNTDGTWQLRPGDAVSIGDHRLRVDQLGTDGKVAHRIELPFSRAEPELTKLVEGQVIVQPGNSLWRIARRSYGQGLLFTVIYEANKGQIRDPDLIYPGQIFALPQSN
jgi:nucleoid-associated protein YgaU